MGPKLRKREGSLTSPELPPKLIVELDGVLIEHYYRGGDHAPPHAHVVGQGEETRIGQNGHPIQGDAPLSADQRRVVFAKRAEIRKAIRKIGRWHWFGVQ